MKNTGHLTSAALSEALRDVEATMQRWVNAPGYNDVLGPIASEFLQTGGKRLRARLALATCGVFKVAPQAAVAWAAACELAHNATLIHDDLQDGDTVRRNQPTTWVRYGAAQAINAGDLLLMLPVALLADAPLDEALRWRMSQALAERMATVIRGQAMECGLLAAGSTDAATYNRTIRGKTSALFELPVYGAALASGCTPSEAAALTAPFCGLGVLFQMQDDVLDLFGDKGREQDGSDLYEGKISALVVAHLERVPSDRDALMALLRLPRDDTPHAQVQATIDTFRRQGALQQVLDAIHAEARAAQALSKSHGEPVLSAVLDELIALVLQPIAHLQGTLPNH